MSIKLIDCFPYNGEHIVRLRLDIVYPYVDEIIIVEAGETHSGIKKDFYYVDKYFDVIFRPYADKITILKIDKFNNEIPSDWIEQYQNCSWIVDKLVWYRETSQRNFPKSYLSDKIKQGEKFLLICSDCDEIPNIKVIKENLHNLYQLSKDNKKQIKLQMYLFCYSFAWLNPLKFWYKAYIVADECINIYGSYSLDIMRIEELNKTAITNGGWHCSFFMTPYEIINKLESYSHTECNKSEFKNKDYIIDYIEKGIAFFNEEILIPRTDDIILPI